MKVINFIYFLLISIFLISCSEKNLKKSTIEETDLDAQVMEAYQEGMQALEGGDVLYAAKKFIEVETLFPQSDWAPKSALMAAYSYYKQDYYSDAIAELDRFTKLYFANKDLDYAYYLLAICYYEQIIDEKKDLEPILNSKKIFEIIIKDFPSTEYAIDSKFKLDLINDILASKEMYLGRYYFEKKKWIASINRFRTVIDDYETTIYTEEALHRLVEVYYTIGLVEEAKKYTNLLGYNYQSSRWYKNSYSVFDKMYEKNQNNFKRNKKKQNIVIKKVKSLFN